MKPDHPPLKHHYYRLILVGILLLSFALRVYRLGYHSLRGDEGSTYIFGTETLTELIKFLRVAEFHPPLYYTLMHGWIAWAGSTEFALRFASVVTGVLLVASVAALGRLLLDDRLGAIAAFLIAVNPYQVFYAQDARAYPLVTLLGVSATISLCYALKGERWRDWIIYGLLVLGAMYTHYSAALIVVFQGIFVAWDSLRQRRFPGQYAVIGIAAGLLFLPWFVSIQQLLTDYRGYGESVNIVDALWRPLTAFAGGQFLESEIAWGNAVFFLPFLCFGLVGLWVKHRPAALLMLLYLLVPLVGVYIASQFKPVFDERYLIIASPAFYLLISAGLVWLLELRRTWLAAASLLLVVAVLLAGGVALSNYYLNPRFAKSPPWREVLDYIAQKAHPEDAVVYTAPLPTIQYYNKNRVPAYLVIPRGSVTSLTEATGELRQVFKDHARVWLIPAAPGDWPVSHEIEPWLDRHSVRLDQTFFRIVHIGLYEAPAAFFAAMEPQTAVFADGLHLRGFRLGDGDSSMVVEAGEVVPLTLVWYAEHSPKKAYTVFTHLVDTHGMLWGQWDNPPVWGTYPTTEWAAGETVFDQYQIPVDENTPPGKYHLLVGLYDPVSGDRLPVVDERGEPIGDHFRLEQEVTVR
jgi:4-amino-4-deoxy-L-arabinose transferase-like glycosyltransferase